MRHEMECHVEPIESDVDREALLAAEQAHLAVAGMGCPKCAHRVRNTLVAVPGVVAVEVDADRAVATVWYTAGKTDVNDLVRGVARASEGTHHDYMGVPIRSRFR